jgi:hypothetical protein
MTDQQNADVDVTKKFDDWSAYANIKPNNHRN